jgi:hypothetical protein
VIFFGNKKTLLDQELFFPDEECHLTNSFFEMPVDKSYAKRDNKKS